MAVPESTIWDRDPHTEAKHRVLSKYFDAWYPIMLRTFPRLSVFEGYAGPGGYSKGEDGSPVIALSNLVQRPELLNGGKAVRFVFGEARQDRLEKFKEVIGQKLPQLPGGITVDYHHGACEDTWLTALDQANAWGMPIFANLDPFGPGVPNGLVQHILVDALTAHKRMFDVAGHYARAAVVRLVVDRRAKPTATFIDDTDLASVAATDANTPEPTMN